MYPTNADPFELEGFSKVIILRRRTLKETLCSIRAPLKDPCMLLRCSIAPPSMGKLSVLAPTPATLSTLPSCRACVHVDALRISCLVGRMVCLLGRIVGR